MHFTLRGAVLTEGVFPFPGCDELTWVMEGRDGAGAVGLSTQCADAQGVLAQEASGSAVLCGCLEPRQTRCGQRASPSSLSASPWPRLLPVPGASSGLRTTVLDHLVTQRWTAWRRSCKHTAFLPSGPPSQLHGFRGESLAPWEGRTRPGA